jgi:hypothetical protein
MVHILEDGETQVYSSLMFEGQTIIAVMNGVYKVAFDYETNEVTRRRIDDFCVAEAQAGRQPHTIPPKTSGVWSGTLLAYGPDQMPAGEVKAVIRHEPTSLLRARQTVTLTGLVNKQYTFDRYHDGNLHTYDGPGMYGNGRAYGRALYTTQHLFGEATKIQGREFLYDDKLSLSANWKWIHGDRMAYMLFGSLAWTAD